MTNKENIKMQIGKRVTLIRRDIMHMTKCDFAKLIGMKNQYLGAVEKGERGLTTEKIIQICKCCNISSDYLLFGVQDKTKEEFKTNLKKYSETDIDMAFDIMKDLSLLLK